MKLNYDQETDSLYIDLNSRPSADSREVQEGVAIDVDAKGKIVGIDIQHAGQAAGIRQIALIVEHHQAAVGQEDRAVLAVPRAV